MAKASTDRVAEILRQHEERLPSCLGEGRTEEADLFIAVLLPVLSKHAGRHCQRAVESKLGKQPSGKYNLELI